MKTFTLNDDDVFELRYLRDRLDRDERMEQRDENQKAAHSSGGAGRSQAVRDAAKAGEVLEKILTQVKG